MWIVTKEAIAAIVRTIVPTVYAWLFTALGGIAWLSSFIGFIPSEPTPGVTAAVAGAVAGVIYVAIRWLAEKFPFIGYFLVINHAPSYADLEPPATDTLIGDRDAPSQDEMEA